MSNNNKVSLEELKANNEAPEWLSEEGFSVISKGYLLPDETPRTAWKRVVSGKIESHLGIDRSERLFSYLWKGWLGLASPVFSNLNTSRGLPISCYSIHVGDSISGILSSNTELAMLAKHGGGVGAFWGDVRARGSKIQNGLNGTSEGVIPFMHMQDSTTIAVSQGGTRKGASAAYLPIEHGDAEEFIRMRRPSGDVNRQNLNIHHGVTIGDDFMKSLTDSSHLKHKHNRSLWLELLKTRLETGEPYIMFRDTVNNTVPDCYKANNLKVETSNLCLSGDTKVLLQSCDTVPIRELVDRVVSIYDGENWVLNCNFRKTQDSATLYRISLSNGSYVDATENHRWFIVTENGLVEKRTNTLIIGDFLETSLYSVHSEVSVVSVDKLEGFHEVYCTTVPSTTKFALANGLMTGNCSEILLHTDENNSFVCCLSSVNIDKYDEWKDDSLFIQDCIWFLDAVIEEFIDKASHLPSFERAVNFAKNSRALGLGALGYHSYLQRKNLPFDSFESMMLNSQIFKKLHTESLEGSRQLALAYGEPEWCKGFGIRNTHTCALAPTATNSVISGGVSPGIEPIIANAFLQKTAKGTFLKKNPTLVPVLDKYNQNNDDIWKQIAISGGSVQDLSFLSSHEREVFKTAYEINQVAIIKQAASRQKYIDQGQSLNIFVPHNINPKLYHLLHMEAWKSGVKTLYYSRSTSTLSNFNIKDNINLNECKACEG